MIKVFEDMDIDWEGDVCKALKEDADFCGDWVACFSGNDPACSYKSCKTKSRPRAPVLKTHALVFVRSGTLEEMTS